MNILLVRTTGFPPDLRIEKEAQSLLQAGHSVHLLCAGKKDELSEDFWREMRIHRVIDDNKLPSKLINLIYYLFRINLRFALQTRKLLKNHNIDIVCIYNTPFFPTIWLATRFSKIPLILEILEFYPASLRYLRQGLLARLKNPLFISKFIDKLSTRKANSVIVMAAECGELLFRYGVSFEKLHVITNAWQLDNKVIIDKRLKRQYEGKYVISYVGLVNASHRGVDIAIRALPYIRKSIPEALLLIVGDGKLLQSMKELVTELKLEHYVAFTGWVPFDYVPTYISLSRVGLLPLRINDHTDTTLPHKLFQYMAFGKPVVASTARAMARIINQTNTGYLVPPEDPVAIAEAIIDLYKNPEKTNQMGNNGIKCVKELYNWESEFIKLNNLYLSLQSNIQSLK